MSLSYKDAGVDTKEGERAVKLMKEHVRKTFDSGVLTGLGSFGSLYKPNLEGISTPVLVAGSDGVGTKLKIAFMTDKHDTVGQDLVAMCVNDVLCQGAQPMFFLDYIATGKVKAEKIADMVKGVADGCVKAGCALVGGETAEMPDFYADGEYDMAGFAVGIVDENKIIDGSKIKDGDIIIGLPSSGIHSNGYSLVRKVFFDKAGKSINDKVLESYDTLGDALIEPTKIYTKAVTALLNEIRPNGMIHITGGGFYENIPRIIPEGLGVRISADSWSRPEIFSVLQELGNIEEKDMFSTFNMGIGFMIIVDQGDVDLAVKHLVEAGGTPYVIGEVMDKDKISDSSGVDIC
jgi:phosphoribosylformylglycinamidine cyclo-ligase